MRTRFTFLMTVLAFSALTGQARAGASAWADDPGGRMRVLVTAPESDGTIRAALQVEPAEGFITYWREPGESGIPPHITVSGDANARLETIAYPVPERIDLAGVTDMGYDGPVTFPLTLKADPGALPQIDISAFIGLCKDICIPFQATFEITPTAYDDSAVANAILAVTAATLPEAPSPDFRVDRAERNGDALKLTLILPTAEQAEITLASSDGFVVEATEGVMDAGGYVITIPADRLPDGLESLESDWLLLAKSGERAMETTLVFEADPP